MINNTNDSNKNNKNINSIDNNNIYATNLNRRFTQTQRVSSNMCAPFHWGSIERAFFDFSNAQIVQQ